MKEVEVEIEEEGEVVEDVHEVAVAGGEAGSPDVDQAVK